MALTVLGTWEISPVSARTAAATRSVVSASTAPAGATDVATPSASSVIVATPSRIVAS